MPNVPVVLIARFVIYEVLLFMHSQAGAWVRDEMTDCNELI